MGDIIEERETRGLGLLLTIADANQESLIESGIDPELARKAALQAADRIRHEHGGTQMYIPKGAHMVLTQRDWQIWEEFNTNNRRELAKKYDLTERSIYLIIARCRVEHDRKHQLLLFG
ncbi:MAG: hypothetical protein L3J57_01725 [Desulfuromusa sp.]|nr:hypothetical protein [Desulfuromusa sp.]